MPKSAPQMFRRRNFLVILSLELNLDCVPFSSQQLLHNLSRNVSKVYNTAIQKKVPVRFYGKNYMKRVRISIFLLDSNKFFIRIQALDPILTNLREKEQLNKTKLNFWKRIFVHGKIK